MPIQLCAEKITSYSLHIPASGTPRPSNITFPVFLIQLYFHSIKRLPGTWTTMKGSSTH